MSYDHCKLDHQSCQELGFMHTPESSVPVHTQKMRTHTRFLGNKTSFLRAQNIIL